MKENRENLITELLGKPEFKQWVVQPTEESNYFWNKWMKEHPHLKDSALQAREVILRIQFERKEFSEAEKEQLLDRIISASQNISYPKHKKSKRWLKYAAVLALIVSSTAVYFMLPKFGTNEQIVEVKNIIRTNPQGQKSIVHLPDGSLINLNSNSTLTYQSDFLQNRYIELTGEAYFQVKKNPSSPFVVKSGEILTTALGTSFNVNTKTPKIEVILVEGSVKVEKVDNSDEFEILKPNQKIHYDESSGLSSIQLLSNLNATLWTQGILSFDNTPLSEVTKILEDWFAVRINIEGDYKNLKYSGKFEKEHLSNILKAMSFSLDLEYAINKKEVEIKIISNE